MEQLSGYALVEPKAPLRAVEHPVTDPGAGEVVVKVAGCGLCHTDLGFAFGGVRTRHPLPLILGHEIAGRVVQAGRGVEHLLGTSVVVPAVVPCGACDDCLAGAPMICKRQIMPGNDIDGGFASHVLVPARGLCPVPGANGDFDAPLGKSGVTLRHLAVIADAASTPYQAIQRAQVREGDLAIVVGLGGVGGYAAQIAAYRGAHVVGLDLSEDRRASAPSLGCELALDPTALQPRALKAVIRAFA